MRRTQHNCMSLSVAAIVGGLAVPTASAQMPCGYEVTAIVQAPKCPPHGYPATLGLGISEPIDGGLPNVVGFYLNCAVGPNTAFVWIGNENKFTTLDFPFGTSQSQANDISDDGTRIVGTADVVGEGTRAFLFDGDDLIVIPPAKAGSFSQAWALNNQSPVEVVGTTVDPRSGFKRAFVWQDEVMTLIEPSFGPRSSGRDVSEFGAVVGWMGTSTADAHAFLWESGIVTDLGPIPGGFTSEGSAINDIRQIVGRGKIDTDGQTLIRAFLWEDDQFLDLGTLPGFDRCAASDINNSTTIIGGCDQINNPNNDRPFVWSSGLMMDVNGLIPAEVELTIKRVDAINEAGQITGRGTTDSGDVVAFVLTPVEPPLGDLNGDCEVGVSDLLILLASWGPCDDCDDCPADLNGNCVVGVADLLNLLANWSS